MFKNVNSTNQKQLKPFFNFKSIAISISIIFILIKQWGIGVGWLYPCLCYSWFYGGESVWALSFSDWLPATISPNQHNYKTNLLIFIFFHYCVLSILLLMDGISLNFILLSEMYIFFVKTNLLWRLSSKLFLEVSQF